MEDAVLQKGRNCWRIAPARRASVLIDGASYFGALRAALAKAEHSILIVGWDIDSRAPLVGPSGEAEDGRPKELGAFLTRLIDERPQLRIHLLLWDYSVIYALDREPLPALNLRWATPPQISVCIDDVLPVGASHHQKIVVIDDSLAFSGGLDLTIRRWDVSIHEMHDDRRRDPGGNAYRPFHDIQMMVDGSAAQALAELVRQRWWNAACEKLSAVSPSNDPWPVDVAADFTDVSIGISRTCPAYEGEPEVREVEALYLDAIARAERVLYFENQFYTAHRIAEALVARMRENPALEVLIVAPNVHHTWLEEQAMNVGALRFMRRFEEAGIGDRLALRFPSLPDDDSDQGVMVHAKFLIVDDRLLRIGSANLTNRSMGTDSECDLSIEAASERERETIAGVRNRLLAEHLGVSTSEVADAIASNPSFLGAIRRLSGGGRCLKPISLDHVTDDELGRTVANFADPEKPIFPPPFISDMFGGSRQKPRLSRMMKVAAAAVLVLSLVAIWHYTPLSGMTNPDALLKYLDALGRNYWMPGVIFAAYLLGTLVAFPVTALIIVTGMMFEPLVAVAYAIGGSLLGASATYLIGRIAGRDPLRNLLGPRVNRISRALGRQGVLSIAALRMVPIAPFTFVNLAAGASHIRFLDFILGTLLGMAPGILIITLMGGQVARVLRNPTWESMGLLALGVVAWLGLSVVLQLLASRLRARGG